jgi:hypothetical protein
MRLRTSNPSSWRTIAVLAVGISIGTTMVATPAAGHITSSVLHVRDHMAQYFYTKGQSNTRFVNALPGTDKANTAAQADNATNADQADNATSAGFAENAGALDGIDSLGFYAAGSKVADSSLLDGRNAADFDNAATLGGRLPADFDDATTLNGRAANGLVRVARTTAQAPISGFPLLSGPTNDQTFGTLSITAPAAGFVFVTSNISVRETTACTAGCDVHARIRHNQTTQHSMPTETSVNGAAQLSSNFVVAVNAGLNTFDIRARRVNSIEGVIEAIWAEMSAIYVPFGATGGPTLGGS